MKLKTYQWGELVGMFFLLASTAAQIFYVEPLKREIDWRLATFSMQQNGQLQIKAVYETRIALLRSANAAPDAIAASEKERDADIQKYQTADANIADYLLEKEVVEGYLQTTVMILFALGTLLAGYARAMEMRAAGRSE